MSRYKTFGLMFLYLPNMEEQNTIYNTQYNNMEETEQSDEVKSILQKWNLEHLNKIFIGKK